MGDKVTRGSLCLPHVYTINQLVDIITKTLSKHQFFLLGFKIGVFNVEASSSIDVLSKKIHTMTIKAIHAISYGPLILM